MVRISPFLASCKGVWEVNIFIWAQYLGKEVGDGMTAQCFYPCVIGLGRLPWGLLAGIQSGKSLVSALLFCNGLESVSVHCPGPGYTGCSVSVGT